MGLVKVHLSRQWDWQKKGLGYNQTVKEREREKKDFNCSKYTIGHDSNFSDIKSLRMLIRFAFWFHFITQWYTT